MIDNAPWDDECDNKECQDWKERENAVLTPNTAASGQRPSPESPEKPRQKLVCEAV